MRVATLILTMAGTSSGGLALLLLMSGWLGLVPYALIAAGALLILAAVVGAVSRQPLGEAAPTSFGRANKKAPPERQETASEALEACPGRTDGAS